MQRRGLGEALSADGDFEQANLTLWLVAFHNAPLKFQSPRARCETLDLRAAYVRQRQQQVRGWRILRDDVPVGL
jgi:hypothetical protein